MKKKILILTNYCGVYTGFGRNCKSLLTYLYKNYKDDFELVLVASGLTEGQIDFEKYPWKTRGTLPNDQRIINELNKDPMQLRMASYGDYRIEEIVKEEKPDVILAVEDAWGTGFLKNKSFFNKIPVIFWDTLDSLPILKDALDTASKTKYYWTWSEFAAKELRETHNQKHVVSQYPCLDTDKFYRLKNEERFNLRKKHNIHNSAVIFGFVFRNQLRKLVNKLIEGYSIFKKNNPEIKNSFLYLHTNFSEGWNIPDLCKQYGVDIKEILCTYIDKNTREYFISSFNGQDLENPKTKQKNLITTNVQFGVSEEQLNEIYNIFDFYIHPATSGACEMPCVESALTELIVATSDYSFGEDIIALNKGSFNIDYNLYTEIGTQFLKSNQNPNAIAKLMKKFYSMDKTEKEKLGKLSRQWAIDNYSTEINGKKIAEFLKQFPKTNYDFSGKVELKNPNAQIPEISDDKIWIKTLYKEILKMDVPDDDSGLNHWLSSLKNKVARADIEKYFRNVAVQENQKQQTQNIDFSELLIKNDKKHFLIVLPGDIGDLVNSLALLKSFRESYDKKEWNIYFATQPQYFEVLEGQEEYIDKLLPYQNFMDSELICTGQGNHKGFFDGYCFISIATQRFLSYLTNNNLSLQLNTPELETITYNSINNIKTENLETITK